LAENAVDLVVSSPPYHVEKDYEKNWTWNYFTHLMMSVFTEVHRVLRPGGYFVVNFGDVYNSGNRFYDSDVPSVYPISIDYFKWGTEAGFDLQATRIWRKKFAKIPIPFVCNSHPRPVFDFEHIWVFRKKNGSNKEIVNDRKLSQRGVVGEDWSSPAKLGIHCASFPIDLPLWAIQVYSQVGDTVLDPFMGAGTTGAAALHLKRHFVGIEKDSKYFSVAKDRVEAPTIEF
jgi:DNA modification methylase